MLYPLITRTKQWWHPKAGNLLSAVYLAIFVYKITVLDAYLYTIPAIITILGIGLFGYFFNDFSDLKSDLLVNKPNMVQKLRPQQRVLLLVGFLFMALTPWIYLPFDQVSCWLLIAEFVLLLAYALPPIRLKEKGFLALVTDALYAYAIPFTLAFHTFNLFKNESIDWLYYFSVFVWQFAVGLVNILIHQLEDYENDVQTQTRTWVITIGKVKAKKYLLYVFIPLMLISFLAFCSITSLLVWSFYFGFPIALLLVKYIIIFKSQNFSKLIASKAINNLQQINVHFHYFMPYYHLVLLVFLDVKFIGLLVCHAFLFNTQKIYWWGKEVIYNCFLKYIIVDFPSKTLNYSIYYFRIWVLRETKQQARRAFFEEYQSQQIDNNKKRSQPNVVFVSSNEQKYTETFIAQHQLALEEAGYYIHRFFGGYLPTHEQKKGHLLSNNQTIVQYYQWKAAFFGFEKEYYLKKRIINYLKNNAIELVVAEFGQSGAEMVSLCKEAQVPLMVTFYGYDAHHQKVIQNYEQKYNQLFQYASAIVGVSTDIVSKLASLGAPQHKLIYLPCMINLDLFDYSDHSKNEMIFLAVGRFSETKSPHLTLLAFNEVVKTIPQAQLIFIGKDGGGELFESCVILAKALNIDDKVVFKGVCTPIEVRNEMRKARVFVQHSLTTPIHGDKEGTPVAIMEAMLMGLPVISTKHAGILDIIQSGKNGFLVDEFDYLNMSKLMIEVAQNDHLVASVGSNASDSILTNSLLVNNKLLFLELVNKCISNNE